MVVFVCIFRCFHCNIKRLNLVSQTQFLSRCIVRWFRPHITSLHWYIMNRSGQKYTLCSCLITACRLSRIIFFLNFISRTYKILKQSSLYRSHFISFIYNSHIQFCYFYCTISIYWNYETESPKQGLISYTSNCFHISVALKEWQVFIWKKIFCILFALFDKISVLGTGVNRWTR